MHLKATGNNYIARLLLVTFLLGLFALASAQAADPSVEALVDEIKAQIDKGEKQRLADPWFLRDLRQIISKYDYPWRKPILLENFDSKGPKPPAPWQVKAGEFLIDWRHGLRSVVEAPAAAAVSGSETQNEDLATALVGALLQQVQGKKSAESKAAPEPRTDPGYAQIDAPVPITNAFAMELELTARDVTGVSNSRLEIGPYTETSGTGYRVVYHGNAPAGSASLELIRRSTAGGSSVLEPYTQPLQLEDGQTHRLHWTRDDGGNMVVSMDGNEVLRVTDRGVRDAFIGLTIVNQAGDFAFRKVQIDGVN